jgi:hypothetical protein
VECWRKLHNEELHRLCVSPNNIKSYEVREDKVGGSCSMHGRNGKYKIFVLKPEGERQLGISRPRWKITLV